jgi:Holliday junction resolvase RusA-like endonuclease
MTITLEGEPRSTNKIYRHGRGISYMSKEGKALKLSYQYQARTQWKGKPREDELEVWITLFFGTKRRADWDNFHKLSCDALTGIAWKDDSQIKDAHVSVQYDKERPRIELEIL